MMKKFISLLASAAIAVSVIPMAVFAEGEPIGETETPIVERSLKLNRDVVIREEIPKEMFGYNSENSRSSYVGGLSVRSRNTNFLMLDDETVNPQALEDLKDYPFCHIRFGGTSSQNRYWKENLGALYERPVVVTPTFDKDGSFTGKSRNDTYSGLRHYISNYQTTDMKPDGGYVSDIKMFQEFDPDVSFTVTLNVLKDTYENNIDLVEFLTSDGETNPNGGENWGLKRKQMGIDKVNLYAYELGNENDLAKYSITEEINMVKKMVAGIRTVDKETPIAVAISTSDTGSVGVDFQRRLLIECGDIIDYFVVHKYFTYNSVTAVCEPTLRNLINDIEKFGDPERHKILFTEYNTGWITKTTDWCKNTSISSAVTIADYMIRMMNYPQVIECDFHALNCGGGDSDSTRYFGTITGKEAYGRDGGPWWSYYTDYDGDVKPTAPLDILKLMYQGSKDAKMIGVDLENFELGRGATVSACAFERPNGDILLYVANLEQASGAQINLEDSGYYLKKKTDIYGTNGMYSMNFHGVKEVKIEETNYKTFDECKTLNLRPVSFSEFVLAPIK